MRFSPILIPSLNRPLHLKKLLDSLKDNVGVEETDIYISVDYPPLEKYKKGNDEVKEMLENYDFSAFKSHNIYFQTENLGIIGNYNFLISKIEQSYSSFIFTEDDNVFSKNFLLYMNDCLEFYQRYNNIISINSCNDYNALPVDSSESIVYSKTFVPYGVGKWIEKEKKINDEVPPFILNTKKIRVRDILALMKKNPILCKILVQDILFKDFGFFYVNGRLWVCDTVISIYMFLSDKYCVIPASSKSFTIGNDGSGANMPAIDSTNIELDDSSEFKLVAPNDIVCNNLNYKLGYKHLKKANRSRIFSTWLFIIIMILLGKNRNRMIRFNKFLRKIFRRK